MHSGERGRVHTCSVEIARRRRRGRARDPRGPAPHGDVRRDTGLDHRTDDSERHTAQLQPTRDGHHTTGGRTPNATARLLYKL